ncbi:MAG: hypothetical protein LBI61_00365 [Puniceicoccales bacterium]|jgi:23S rRNA-/tRNA-specific pseudouridylate synthase|nr:hypothetical protein [Puniceicoccales bacterium]
MGCDFIVFSGCLAGEKSVRMPILFDCAEFLAIDKPANVDCSAVIDQMRSNISRGGSTKLGIGRPMEIFSLDGEISGVFFIAKNRESAANLRNLHGSQAFKFTFDFLTFPSGIDKGTALVCDLPIGKHRAAHRMLISHKTGKKSHTEFAFVENVGKCEHWTASCSFFRRHQVRIHAHECGLHLVGEKLYADSRSLNLAKKFRKFDGADPHWSEEYFPLHLSCVEMHGLLKVAAKLAKKFQATVNLLRKYQSATATFDLQKYLEN